jgi:hypothetical protein
VLSVDPAIRPPAPAIGLNPWEPPAILVSSALRREGGQGPPGPHQELFHVLLEHDERGGIAEWNAPHALDVRDDQREPLLLVVTLEHEALVTPFKRRCEWHALTVSAVRGRAIGNAVPTAPFVCRRV